ncbi:CinA family protein [Rhodococcus sp. BP-252]|uniref:Damage-inducible protein CinA n=1 Tax=Rhodococcoides kyotonense TaxID=398843 RepID=A0A177Y6N1_9NOCA|nr:MULTISPECIES: CinA family protein [Rhodococcus]MBY6410374.1 CinA family protein [Rhodococcus sp. BP-320]MBY6416256.1 CinA family protein [Rhodococcus sp. BP-321]MBY6420251.1 CinA family protein [Rhodococcus sp. BP-324]MBY6424930.1 CinA family protein [Rhodococcus sp. BP-323]MBY6430364.1 CinA family protein [Rhodococcus sp. BP-322]
MSTSPEERIDVRDDLSELCEELSELALEHSIAVATVESLTAGNLAAMLGKAPSSGDWFRGGIVAYDADVKHSLLRVPEGPVVSEVSAATMARSACELLGADMAIAVTGEAGPETQENEPPGTVWVGMCDRGVVTTERKQFDGEPEEILAQTLSLSIESLVGHARRRSA